MRTEFDMKINTMAMYRFLMNHTYRGMNGLFSILAGIGLIAYYVLSGKDTGSSNSWIFLVFGVLFLVYQPWTLYSKALKQTKLNPVFKHPLHYVTGQRNAFIWVKAQLQNEKEVRTILEKVMDPKRLKLK